MSNPGGPNQREKLCDKTKLNEAALDQMLRFENAESRTHEGKFNFLIQQKRHVLTPQISVIMSTQKLDINHPGYQRPKVPMQTMVKHGAPNQTKYSAVATLAGNKF